MGKESIVEIPEGSGNKYRYEYQDGATVYRGPVGSAPPLDEEHFFTMVAEGVITEFPGMKEASVSDFRGWAGIPPNVEDFDLIGHSIYSGKYDSPPESFDDLYYWRTHGVGQTPQAEFFRTVVHKLEPRAHFQLDEKTKVNFYSFPIDPWANAVLDDWSKIEQGPKSLVVAAKEVNGQPDFNDVWVLFGWLKNDDPKHLITWPMYRPTLFKTFDTQIERMQRAANQGKILEYGKSR